MLHDFADQYVILIVTGLGALVIAGIVFLFGDPGSSSEAAAAGESEPLAPVEAEGPEYASVDRRGRRYLEIYGALAVPPREELIPVPVSVGVHEEALGTRAASEQDPAREPDLPWPLNVRAAKARKLPS